MFLFKKVLCQGCLKLEKFTLEKHLSKIKCDCGSDFCGCNDCQKTIKLLKRGITEKSILGTKRNIIRWSENYGILQQ
jgi:hypothetical protein